MAFLFNGYVRLLRTHTLATQMVTGGCCSATGDIIYQQGFEKRGLARHEWFRTRRLIVWGAIVFAPCAFTWHSMLNKVNIGGKWTTVISRTLIDGAIFAPFATCLFYATQGTMERRSWISTQEEQGIIDRLKERLFPTVVKQWSLFVPVTLMNMTIIPVYGRPPFMSFFAVGWSVFLSSAQNAGKLEPGSNELGGETAAIVAVEIMA